MEEPTEKLEKQKTDKKRATIKWVVLITLLILSAAWFLSFYIDLTPKRYGKGATDSYMDIKGMTYGVEK